MLPYEKPWTIRVSRVLAFFIPYVLTPETLVDLVLALSELPLWTIDREWAWRRTLILVGLRVRIDERVLAETLGLGPFQFLPPTRQCPITSLEIRTKPQKAIRHKFRSGIKLAHLDKLPTDEFLTARQFQVRFKKLTPLLKSRILGGFEDQRAKAKVTFAVPAAIWNTLKSLRPLRPLT